MQTIDFIHPESATASQEEVRRIIISDMVKKRNSIVPVIGEDTIVYKDEGTGKEIPFQVFILNELQKKYPRVIVDDAALTSMKERGYYMSQILNPEVLSLSAAVTVGGMRLRIGVFHDDTPLTTPRKPVDWD